MMAPPNTFAPAAVSPSSTLVRMGDMREKNSRLLDRRRRLTSPRFCHPDRREGYLYELSSRAERGICILQQTADPVASPQLHFDVVELVVASAVVSSWHADDSLVTIS